MLPSHTHELSILHLNKLPGVSVRYIIDFYHGVNMIMDLDTIQESVIEEKHAVKVNTVLLTWTTKVRHLRIPAMNNNSGQR